jgi:hypothetical protein
MTHTGVGSQPAVSRRVPGRYCRRRRQVEQQPAAGSGPVKVGDVSPPGRAAYLVNAYRVLLTRARQGMVIYVPFGSEIDDTRKPIFYDETYAFLCECGVT